MHVWMVGNGGGLERRSLLMARRNDPVIFLRTRAKQKRLLSTTATGVLMVQRKGKRGKKQEQLERKGAGAGTGSLAQEGRIC